MTTMNDVFVETFDTSLGVYNRFYAKINNEIVLLHYLPYTKLSNDNYCVKPDLNGDITKIDYVPKNLQEYDENKQYINIFHHNENKKEPPKKVVKSLF